MLNQWEIATEFQATDGANEVHIMGDMNLDILNNKWMDPNYSLVTLSRLVYETCNSSNFKQLIKEPTRLQFNSVKNTTDISCIDHIYTNKVFKCLKPEVVPFGNSDHELISFVRLTKCPTDPSKTIRKRSCKDFDKNKFLNDLRQTNWNEILNIVDIDLAVNFFTEHFKYALNNSAPWIQFQTRKNYAPWITN